MKWLCLLFFYVASSVTNYYLWKSSSSLISAFIEMFPLAFCLTLILDWISNPCMHCSEGVDKCKTCSYGKRLYKKVSNYKDDYYNQVLKKDFEENCAAFKSLSEEDKKKVVMYWRGHVVPQLKKLEEKINELEGKND